MSLKKLKLFFNIALSIITKIIGKEIEIHEKDRI